MSPFTSKLTFFVYFFAFILFSAAAISDPTIINFHTGILDKDLYPSLDFLPSNITTRSFLSTTDESFLITPNVFILQVPTSLTSAWTSELAGKIISFAPPNVFIIRATGDDIQKLQQRFNDSIEYVNVLPSALKQSRRLQFFKSAQDEMLQDNQLYDQIIEHIYNDDPELKAYTTQAVRDNVAKRLSKFGEIEESNQVDANSCVGSVVSNSKLINTPKLPRFCNATANGHIFDELSKASFHPSHFAFAQPTSLSTLLDDLYLQHSTNEPLDFTNSEEELAYDKKRMDLSPENIIYQGLASFDPLSALTGIISYSYTHHLSAMMTTSTLAPQKDEKYDILQLGQTQAEVDTKFKAQVDSLQQQILSLHKQHVDEFLQSLTPLSDDNAAHSMTPLGAAKHRLLSLFETKSDINFTTFITTLSNNMLSSGIASTTQQIHKNHKFTAQQISDSAILSILPFNSIIQHSSSSKTLNTEKTTPINGEFATQSTTQNILKFQTTMKDSRVPLSYLRVQLQSPLFLTSSQQMGGISARIIAQRVDRLHSALATQSFEKDGLKHDVLSIGQIDLHAIKTEIQESYAKLMNQQQTKHKKVVDDMNEQLSEYNESKKAQDTEFANESATNHKDNFIDFNNTFESNNEILTHLSFIQYVDTVILSLFETQQRSAFQHGVEVQSQQDILSLDQTITLLSSFIDVQIQQLYLLFQDTINTLSISPDVHFLDLKLPVAVSNRYLRFSNSISTDVNWNLPSSTASGFSQLGPYYEAGVRGTDVIVGCSDTGSDTKSCFLYGSDPVPWATPAEGRRASTSRHVKFKQYVMFYDDRDVYGRGHGTHVTGTITGFARLSDGSTRSSHIMHSGIAPDARLAFYDIGNARGELILPIDLSELFDNALINGGLLYSNSWGCFLSDKNFPLWACNEYDESAFQIDKYLNENPSFSILMAAGNEGKFAFSTIGSAAIAKNALVVGANSASPEATRQGDPSVTDYTSFKSNPSSYDDLNVLASFSSTGPTYDGRVKPDIITPGQYVFSARSRDSNEQATCVTLTLSGTSMATPGMSGSLALVQQMLVEGRINSGTINDENRIATADFGSSLLRSIAINSAQPVKYRGVIESADVVPLQRQTWKLDPISGPNNVFYNHVSMGTIVGYSNIPIGRSYYFTNQTAPAGTRTLRMMMLIYCTQNAASVQVQVIRTDGSEIASTSFTREGIVEMSRKWLDIPLSASDNNVYFVFTSNLPDSCDGQRQVQFGLQEYSASSVAEAPRFASATCNTIVEDYPQWSSTSLLVPEFVFRCPPAPTCADRNAGGNRVFGMNYYSMTTPVCRAALQVGAVNATFAGATGAQAAAIMNAPENLKEYTYVRIRTSEYENMSGITFRGVSNNGVSSQAFKVKYGTELFSPVTTGTPSASQYLHLSNLPAGPNSNSGWGRFSLATILPLTQYATTTSDTDAVQRKILILSKGTSTEYVTHRSAQSFCFTVSKNELLNSYSYPYTIQPGTGGTAGDYTSSTWTSGPDDLRVTLSWYDIPGSNIASKLLVNDLDLFLFTPDGTEYRGNQRVDHKNNVERINLEPNTFTAGMYCAVVHGVYVPFLEQQFSLVANGRGLERCGDNPITGTIHPIASDPKSPIPAETETVNLSGLWARDTTKTPTCSASVVNTSTLGQLSTIRLRQGGNCISITAPTPHAQYPSNINATKALTDVNLFNGQRISQTYYEDVLNLAEDEANGVAMTPSAKKGFISASGFVFADATFSATYLAEENQFEMVLSGAYDSTAQTLTIVAKQSDQNVCTFVYTLTTSSKDAQFSVISPAVKLIPRPVPFPNGTTQYNFSVSFIILISIYIAFLM